MTKAKAFYLMVLVTLPVLGQSQRSVAENAGGQSNVPVTTAVPGAGVGLPDHKIVPNDLLSISVFDEPMLSKSVRVASDGTIVMPLLQSGLRVEGLLPRELEIEIARRLMEEQILVHPLVTVSITDYATRLISVIGDVKLPGQFPITMPISLLSALAKAGWTTTEAGAELLVTRTDSEAPRKINIRDLQMGTDPSINIMLNGGELVNVPDAPKVWVTGNVTHPQAVPVRNPADATVLKVVASVEGLTQYYAKIAYIYRPDAAGVRHEIAVPLKDIMHRKAQDVTLSANDILLIPDDNGTKRRAIIQELENLSGAASSAAIVFGLQHP